MNRNLTLPRICRKCQVLTEDYYLGRHVCRLCCIKQVKEHNEKKYSISNATVKCQDCRMLKPIEEFPFSVKTNLIKPVCYGCRNESYLSKAIPPEFNKNRYQTIEEWFRTILFDSPEADKIIIRHLMKRYINEPQPEKEREIMLPPPPPLPTRSRLNITPPPSPICAIIMQVDV